MSRIPYPDPDTLSPAKRAVRFGPGPVLNNSRMSMHAKDSLWQAYRGFAQSAMVDSPLEPALRELVIIRTGHLSRSAYEVEHHLRVARKIGVAEEKCAAMQSGDFSCLDPREKTVIDFTTELVNDASPSDATLAAMRAIFSDEELFGVVLLVGAYMVTARIISTGGVELDEVVDP